MLDKVIKVAKSSYESDLIRKNNNNPRNLWKYINTKLGKKTKQNNEINYIKESTQYLDSFQHSQKRMIFLQRVGHYFQNGDILSNPWTLY